MVGLPRGRRGRDGAARMDERQGPHRADPRRRGAGALTRGTATDDRAAELLRWSGAYMVAMGEVSIRCGGPYARRHYRARLPPTAYTALSP
ncbi:MAG: hypothetical protein IPG81_27605 [Sandaracinaceae bacterium]|nr:hypothetical protein [Sandaracinaceae bacterium]